MLERLARFCHRRRWLVVAAWTVLLVGAMVANSRYGGEASNNFSLPGTESQRAFDLLEERFPELSGDTILVTVAADGGLDDPAIETAVGNVLDGIESLGHVLGIASPYEGPGQIAPDGTIGFAVVQLDVPGAELPSSFIDRVMEISSEASRDGLQVELGGQAMQFSTNQSEGVSERVGLVMAVLVLLITFGSAIAMGLPILTALFGLGTALALIGLIQRFYDIVDFAPTLAVMIGIGVGIDYALLVVTRYRHELHAGLEPESAVVVALTTAGRATLFAGFTVVVSLAGLFVIGIQLIDGIAVATITAVALAMVTSITLLPALLGFAGRSIDRLRIPFLSRDETAHRDTMWFRWSRFMQKHPWPIVVGVTLVLLVLAIPVMSMRLGTQDSGNDPPGSTTRKAYDLLSEGFGPGFNGPLLLVIDADSPDKVTAAIESLAISLPEVDGIALVAPPMLNDSGDTAVVPVIPTTSPQDEETDRLITEMRSEVLPIVEDASGATVNVGGITALFVDMSDFLEMKLKVFIGAVLIVSFFLLMGVFRSVVVPLKAVIMNLLSIGAAYGIMVAIFQWGWGAELIGLEQTIPIPPFVPMMLFAVLFGLSMDYEVFMLSRIREEYLRSGDNSLAVADGLATTARVITAAATIMIAVFGSFVLNPDPIVKLFGLGLAVAIFIDAAIVRTMVVPSAMELLGDANWWFPRWLDRLIPQIGFEGNGGVPEPVSAQEPVQPGQPDPGPGANAKTDPDDALDIELGAEPETSMPGAR